MCLKQAGTWMPIEFSVKNENAAIQRLISQANESRKAKASGVPAVTKPLKHGVT